MVRVGNRLIGDGHPSFLVAEIGINHNGDMNLAHRLIDGAAQAGADAVKFQSYRTEDFISDKSLTHEYVSGGKKTVEPQYDLFKRCELSFSQLRELKEHADKRDVTFFATPTSEMSIQELVKMGVAILKNGSDYLTHTAMIRAMAATRLPTVISIGMATVSEIDEAVRSFYGAGGTDLVLLHCVSSYPTAPDEVNLKRIPFLHSIFDCPVGFSDHTEGIVAALGAVALGACMVEKHFTLDKNLPGPDHAFSADPHELTQLVENVRTLEKNLGTSTVHPTPSEERGRLQFRLSCVAARNLAAGHHLTGEDIAFR